MKRVYLGVSKDKYKLPIAYGESAQEIADEMHISKQTVYSCTSRLRRFGSEYAMSVITVDLEDEE